MQISFSQMYIEPGVHFPLSYRFSEILSSEFGEKTKSQVGVAPKFPSTTRIIFRISAKSGISVGETYGPTLVKKTNSVEFSIFLPYDRIEGGGNVVRSVVLCIFEIACRALRSIGYNVDLLELDAARFAESLNQRTDLIDSEDW